MLCLGTIASCSEFRIKAGKFNVLHFLYKFIFSSEVTHQLGIGIRTGLDMFSE